MHRDALCHLCAVLFGENENTRIKSNFIKVNFYFIPQVPEILSEHEEFLDALKKRLDGWDIDQGVGDLLLATVSYSQSWRTIMEEQSYGRKVVWGFMMEK